MLEALQLLDSYLDEDVSLFICGGTAISLRFQSRPTADIDVIEPKVYGSLVNEAKKLNFYRDFLIYNVINELKKRYP